MAKQNTTPFPSIQDMLDSISQRITLLQTVRIALSHALTDNPEDFAFDPAFDPEQEEPTLEERQTAARPPKQTRKVKVKTRGGNKTAILAALADGPLSPEEVFKRMKKAGWKSTSATPRSLVGTTLAIMARNGQLRKVGADYDLPLPPSSAELIASAEA